MSTNLPFPLALVFWERGRSFYLSLKPELICFKCKTNVPRNCLFPAMSSADCSFHCPSAIAISFPPFFHLSPHSAAKRWIGDRIYSESKLVDKGKSWHNVCAQYHPACCLTHAHSQTARLYLLPFLLHSGHTPEARKVVNPMKLPGHQENE